MGRSPSGEKQARDEQLRTHDPYMLANVHGSVKHMQFGPG
jgi:hypothetical protein